MKLALAPHPPKKISPVRLCALVKVSAVIKMFKLLSLRQPSIKKLPISDKSLVTFNFENVNGLKEIGECIDI